MLFLRWQLIEKVKMYGNTLKIEYGGYKSRRQENDKDVQKEQ